MRIALDAMGGDNAPEINVVGAVNAIRQFPELEIALVGQQDQLESLLGNQEYDSARLQIIPSEGFVGMEEKPTVALREKPNCSIAVCWKLLAGKEVHGIVSAGNTGAVVAAGLRTRLFLKNVKRPGIAAPMPTSKGKCVLMDVGANPQSRAEHLSQYGVMGAIYAKNILNIQDPTVRLLNIGSEDNKGTELIQEAQQLLKSQIPESYAGFAEGRDLFEHSADVVVCEGFVGNVLLKSSEGFAEMLLHRIFGEVLPQLGEQQKQAAGIFKSFAQKFQYSEEGGAPLLGVDGTCMICHGSSNDHSITNALKVAMAFHSRGVNDQIVEALS